MTKIHIMLDLETWGKRAGCDIRSIGACVFVPTTGFVHDGSLGTIRPFYQAVDNPILATGPDWIETLGFRPNPVDPRYDVVTNIYRKYDLWRDHETVEWWNEQSDEAQAAFANPIDLRDGLAKFADWLDILTDNRTMLPAPRLSIYAHGPQFDISILEAAYHATGLLVPWHYRAPRDTRTAFDMAGIDDHSSFMARFPVGTLHHALDDAISQARAVCEAFAIVRKQRETES